MQEDRQKYKFRRWEIALLAVLTPIAYIGGFVLLAIWQERRYPDFFESNPYGLSYLIVLGFDVIWIIAMKLWPFKNIKVKIVLTWLVFILSALILTDLCITNIFHSMW